ncbi:MAG: hypothetical protein E5X78_05760 [Mesorhizobium sp.]|nr:MAG: hypothetical protein E5X78_05760 [Mesorhizobium sp.]
MMPDPRQPGPDRDAPMLSPNWKPEPVKEPEPDDPPNEAPHPNPDEIEEPPAHAEHILKQ